MLAYHSTVGHLRQSAATLTHGRCSGRAAHGNSDPPLPDPSTNHAPAPTLCFPLQHCLGLGADVSLRPWTAPSRRSMRHAVTAARSRHHGPDVVPPRVAPGLVAGQGPFLRGQGCAQSRDEASGGHAGGRPHRANHTRVALRPSCLNCPPAHPSLCPLRRQLFSGSGQIPTWADGRPVCPRPDPVGEPGR
jgi:hypothetical protein